MKNLNEFVQNEMKQARIEALKASTYTAICELLDSQEKELKELREFKEKHLPRECEECGSSIEVMHREHTELCLGCAAYLDKQTGRTK